MAKRKQIPWHVRFCLLFYAPADSLVRAAQRANWAEERAAGQIRRVKAGNGQTIEWRAWLPWLPGSLLITKLSGHPTELSRELPPDGARKLYCQEATR